MGASHWIDCVQHYLRDAYMCVCMLQLENSKLAQLERKNRIKSSITDVYVTPVFVLVQVKALLSLSQSLWLLICTLRCVCVALPGNMCLASLQPGDVELHQPY